MVEGDKFTCKKSFTSVGGIISFTVGRVYSIVEIQVLSYNNNVLVYFIGDDGRRYWFDFDDGKYYFNDYFYSIREVRRKKLERLRGL